VSATTVVAAIIERHGRVLIGQRKNAQPHPLKWEFPGGKVNVNETAHSALVRELEEELGVFVRSATEITRYEYQYPGRPPILLIFYRVGEFEGEPVNRVFHSITWERPEQLRDYDFLEGDLAFIQSYTSVPLANTTGRPPQ